MKNDLAFLCKNIIKSFDIDVVDVCINISNFLSNYNPQMQKSRVEAVDDIKTNLQLILTIGEGIIKSEPHQIEEVR